MRMLVVEFQIGSYIGNGSSIQNDALPPNCSLKQGDSLSAVAILVYIGNGSSIQNDAPSRKGKLILGH